MLLQLHTAYPPLTHATDSRGKRLLSQLLYDSLQCQKGWQALRTATSLDTTSTGKLTPEPPRQLINPGKPKAPLLYCYCCQDDTTRHV